MSLTADRTGLACPLWWPIRRATSHRPARPDARRSALMPSARRGAYPSRVPTRSELARSGSAISVHRRRGSARRPAPSRRSQRAADRDLSGHKRAVGRHRARHPGSPDARAGAELRDPNSAIRPPWQPAASTARNRPTPGRLADGPPPAASSRVNGNPLGRAAASARSTIPGTGSMAGILGLAPVRPYRQRGEDQHDASRPGH